MEEQMKHIYIELGIIIDELNAILNVLNDYTGDIISAVIGAIAIIGAVFVGTQTISKKLSEEQVKGKLQKISENNSRVASKITEILLNIKIDSSGPLHYKNVENFYINQLIPLYKDSLESSVEVCTGCYIVERLTNFLLKLRIPRRYIGYRSIRKETLVDNTYFSYISNMLNLIAFYCRQSITVPEKLTIKKRTIDVIQRKLGGPKINFQQRNIIATMNGINYDTRFNLYSEFYEYIVHQGEDTIKAFANTIGNRIIFVSSKFLIKNKIYAPLYFRLKSTQDQFPPLFLAGIKFSHSLGNTENKKITLIYVNILNWYYFENMIKKELLQNKDIEYYYEKADRKFIYHANVIGATSIGHTVRIDIQRKYSEEIYKKHKTRILKKFKKLHNC
jgi:hypothetical protein